MTGYYRFIRYSKAHLKPIGPIAPNWAPRIILQTLVQVDWDPGPTEIVPNLATHLLRAALDTGDVLDFQSVKTDIF